MELNYLADDFDEILDASLWEGTTMKKTFPWLSEPFAIMDPTDPGILAEREFEREILG